MSDRIRSLLFGKPRNLKDPQIYHRISLIAFLAWVGLGADGLSSSAYGPDEAFRALGPHGHLAILLAIMTIITIAVISIAYSNLIHHFPGGGGGYLVASKLLGQKAGVVSGCALLVDYFLTISVSVAAGCDALWSFLPIALGPYKLAAEIAAVLLLILLNLRGVKESVTFVAPVFLLFVVTHVFMILYALGSHALLLPSVFHDSWIDLHSSVSVMGFWPVAFILLHAYSMGGGTYTGIEAVSNGVSILREPRVETGKKTMFLMAASLAFTASGIILGYLLTNTTPVDGKTMNASLFENLFGAWTLGGMNIGKPIVVVSLMAEAALLFVAAQAGFLDGPRILSNMAVDSYMPHRFSQLSNRLVTQNGVLLMGLSAVGAILYTRGNITALVVMYSINVFVTFSLTELGMARHWILDRHKEKKWKSQLTIHGTGLIMCLCILLGTLYEKFGQGGWMTAVITGAVIGLSFLIRRHYDKVNGSLKRLDEALTSIPAPRNTETPSSPMDRNAPTAVIMVNGFSGFGVHQLLSVQRLLPNHFKNFIFVSVGVVDSGNFKGAEEIGKLETKIREDLQKYTRWCQAHGFHADYRMTIDTEVIDKVEEICRDIAREFPRSIFFTGKLIFQKEKFYHRFLHNDTAYVIQHHLQFEGMQTIVLPIRVY